jgi:hypothetical protein
MAERTPRISFESRLLALVGLSLWLVSGAAGVWEVLALQPPESPFHLGVLSGPISQLRTYSFGLGTLLCVLALLVPLLAPQGGVRLWVVALVVGALLHTGTLLVAASRGMQAVQIFDPREDARTLLYARAVGHGITLLAGVALFGRALRRGAWVKPGAARDEAA